jgi:hypothetical protein
VKGRREFSCGTTTRLDHSALPMLVRGNKRLTTTSTPSRLRDPSPHVGLLRNPGVSTSSTASAGKKPILSAKHRRLAAPHTWPPFAGVAV